MPTTVSNFSFWFALVLSIGSLLFYLSTAFWQKVIGKDIANQRIDFNLGLPTVGTPENLFSIALVAAGTSLSTVFVFFLTAASFFGWWIILSPIMFSIGNFVMFKVYNRIKDRGYFDESSRQLYGTTGLVPYLGQAFTGSNSVGWILALLSLLNLLAVLALELIVGVEVLGYLASHTFQTSTSSVGEFVFFAISVLLLLGYVFIGGFRAVVSSDVWQMKAMKWAIALAIISIVVFGFTSLPATPDLNALSKSPPWLVLWGFILNVILANLFAPLSQESSWQRFRAFAQSKDIHFSKAMNLSIINSLVLWTGLIILAFGIMSVMPSNSTLQLSSMSNVLEVLRTLNNWWFPLFVFPVMTVAALSAMYSTADTCVSSLLYLIEYSRVTKTNNLAKLSTDKLPSTYYISMIFIFFVSLGIYAFVRLWFNPTILQLVFSVFSNLVVIAPTVLSATMLPPYSSMTSKSKRTPYILISLSLGFVAYWTSSISALVMGPSYLWLSQLSIVIGLVGATVPVLPMWLSSPSIEIERSYNNDRS